MSKSICALVHKEGSSRQAFQDYYEDRHAPLAIGLFPFSGYVRNHIIGDDDFGWDTISEFWSSDIEKAAALMQGPIGETMRADEERFMNRSRIAPAGSEPVAISTGDPAGPSGERTVLLLNTGRDEALARARRIGADHPGVSIDFLTPWSEPAFPAEAVIWVSGWPTLGPSCQFADTLMLRARRVATPRGALLGTIASEDSKS